MWHQSCFHATLVLLSVLRLDLENEKLYPQRVGLFSGRPAAQRVRVVRQPGVAEAHQSAPGVGHQATAPQQTAQVLCDAIASLVPSRAVPTLGSNEVS